LNFRGSGGASRLSVYAAGFVDDFDFFGGVGGGATCWGIARIPRNAAATRATDQWSIIRRRIFRFHEVQSIADLLGALAPADKEKTAALSRKIFEGAERYRSDKEDISEKAKEFGRSAI